MFLHSRIIIDENFMIQIIVGENFSIQNSNCFFHVFLVSKLNIFSSKKTIYFYTSKLAIVPRLFKEKP
ncbi:unnamed protein product, partial [Vitis vinifera]|uniref:Uncharacterized protein n=1 Tax=Vitis vinifera TaxID=29760 RepID=D7T5X5_VITVI